MTTPSERIVQIERELQKYIAKKPSAKTLVAIGSNINERIKILNAVHDELIAISKELYYYDMVDYLGNLRIDNLKLAQCSAIANELEKAKNKFIVDNEDKYMTQCEKLLKKIYWVSLNIMKDMMKNGETGNEIKDFYDSCPDVVKERIKKQYYTIRLKSIEKNIKLCVEDVTKHYRMLIMSEILSFKDTFGIEIDKKVSIPGSFGFHIFTVFKDICNKNNKIKIKAILNETAMKKQLSEVDEIFIAIAKLHYCWGVLKSVEI